MSEQQDNKKYTELRRDIARLKAKLSKQASCENFGDTEIRWLIDKYSDYMSGNWTVIERFVTAVKAFEDWCANYVNYKEEE